MIKFPEAAVGEWVGIRTNSASGLFAYRHFQASGLLELPDLGGGDLTAEQRRDLLRSAIVFKKPLAALTIFLGVVALEDFVRDLTARMCDNVHISCHFPGLAELRSQPILRSSDVSFRPLHTDPAHFADPASVNAKLQKAMGVAPISSSEYAKLRDLFLIRHTVAHHAAVVRAVDVPRFQYYELRPGQHINPPPEFVRDTLNYLYRIGRAIETSIIDRVFSVMLPTMGDAWWDKRPPNLLELIEFFDFFGVIESTNGPVGNVELGTTEHTRMLAEAVRIKEALVVRCVSDLRMKYVK